ncbi:AraC family transcriptional regulator [Paenibacillus sp. MMS18-CY102]|uniref:AraC family transcriptional regulator n=1 Tax=Paenibacillus sp. MMS18-CY102 TaxID=2682849 RepID=UPI00136629EC|nr:AraC family transcriptional regulator [Paenibacillus sp. MMS18-CY102]MWC27153.1 helix-turn-helix domain-containing protein [Paenibacillus sp. MMS18-CY102]
MSFSFEIPLLGVDTPHHVDFVIDHTRGGGAYLLACFSTPFFIRTMNGIENGQPGDCILHDPTFPQYHGTARGEQEGFRNDWVYVEGDGMLELAQTYGIPFNTLIRTGEKQLLASHIRTIESELALRKPFWKERIALVLQEAMFTIGRHQQLIVELEQYKPSEREYRKKFIEARSIIHQRYAEPWDVQQMGNLVNLSAVRFSVLFQTFFQASPKEDLIIKRIEEAKLLLHTTNDSIERISAACGFNSLYYFSRIFKIKVGCSPVHYRKRLGG